MSRAWTRRLAVATASAALLSGAAAGSAAFAAPAPNPAPGTHSHALHGDPGKHTGEHDKGDHGKGDQDKGGKGKHLGWEKGVDKKQDRFDKKGGVWQRYDADSRTYAQWDEHNHCWKRKVNGHWQKWDMNHKAWK
ncbi:hypothetical protein [Streptomyces sp. NPDC002537]